MRKEESSGLKGQLVRVLPDMGLLLSVTILFGVARQ